MTNIYENLKEYVRENELLLLQLIHEVEDERRREETIINNDTPKVYGYIRVSTNKQKNNYSLEEQQRSIESYYPDAEIYEEAHTGKRSSDLLIAIIEKMNYGDTLVVTKVDRFSRDVVIGTLLFQRLIDKGCKLHVLTLGILDDSAYSKMNFVNLLNIAEFDRKMMLEKMSAAKNIARNKEGYHEGRPNKYTPEELEEAAKLLGFKSYRRVSLDTGISVATLTRYRRKKANEIKQDNNDKDDYYDDYDF